jgi:hypothetical protein
MAVQPHEGFQVTASDFPNICPGCPKLRALIQRHQQVTESSDCEASKSSYENYILDQIHTLDRAASEANCSKSAAELPGPETKVPELGPEWGDYVRQCGAHALRESGIS